MADCCDSPVVEAGAQTCLTCGHRGVAVQLQTVKALLTEKALRRVQLTHYRFCGNPVCNTVYSGAAGDHFDTLDVRVPVWQKEPFGARLLCYCFGETESSIRGEVTEHGHSQSAERIRGHVTAQRCACEIRNPRGNCCLGDILGALKRIETPCKEE